MYQKINQQTGVHPEVKKHRRRALAVVDKIKQFRKKRKGKHRKHQFCFFHRDYLYHDENTDHHHRGGIKGGCPRV
jgi:hypothetical protein